MHLLMEQMRFILGLLIGEIGNIYENPDVGQLCNLKDFEGEEHE